MSTKASPKHSMDCTPIMWLNVRRRKWRTNCSVQCHINNFDFK